MVLSPTSQHGAITELFALSKGHLWPAGPPAALAEVAGASFAEALGLQLGVLDEWEGAGERLGGWKIGLTSRAARDSMGTDVRPHGYVLASRILDSGATLTAQVPNCRLEPEVAVTLGADLAGPDVTVEQARNAVSSVAPAFEINSNRVSKQSSLAIRLGNALNNWGIVVGPQRDPDDVELAALTVEIGDDQGAAETGTSAPETLDDPYQSLARVCRSLALNGRGLSAGQVLITGSVTAPIPVGDAHGYYADFGALGRVTLNVA